MMMPQTFPNMAHVAEVDGVDVYYGDPDGRGLGLWRLCSTPVEDRYFGPDWEMIPVSPRQTGEVERLRSLRLEAAKITNGKPDLAREIYDFLRRDSKTPKDMGK
jgi:hypothetical protein